MSFHVSQTLFSSHAVDVGTEFLLRTLHRTGARFQKVLDLGSGYGPIGIALKGLNPEAVLHMVDRDALAVTYAARNALLNGIDDAMTYPSIGFDDVEERDFDLVASNIPGKANEEVIASWLRDAALSVRDKGQIAIVVVSALEPFVSEVISGMPGAKIVLSKRRSGHTVFIYAVDHVERPTPLSTSSFDRGDYDRTQAVFSRGQVRFSMKTVFGLPQFDSLSYLTLLLIDVLRSLDAQPTRALVLNRDRATFRLSSQRPSCRPPLTCWIGTCWPCAARRETSCSMGTTAPGSPPSISRGWTTMGPSTISSSRK